MMSTQAYKQNQAPVFSVMRASLHDGPGVRTVAYLKGCSLRCRWCHNPEGFSPEPDVLFYKSRCTGCGRCTASCPICHPMDKARGRARFLRARCTGCGQCTGGCPTGALALCGTAETPESLVAKIEKDRHFFRATGGGVTLSGGECLLHPRFSRTVLDLCRQAGIHTAVETALGVPWSSVQAVLPATDLIIADLKHMDGTRHREATGAANARILDNLRRVSREHSALWIRIPLIPGFNDDDAHLRQVAVFVDSLGEGLQKVELLKYNHLARSKYAALGKPYFGPDTDTQTDSKMKESAAVLRGTIRRQITVC